MLTLNRSYLVIENNLILVPLVILSVAISVLLVNYLIVGIAAIIISILIILYGERFLLGLIIVSLLSIVNEFGSTIRLFVQIISFSLIGFLFIKHYGLNFTKYPKVPKSVLYFLALYYLAMIITSILSQYFFAGVMMIGRQTIFFIIAYIFYALIRELIDVKTIVVALIIVASILAIGAIYDFIASGTNMVDLVLGSRYRGAGFMGAQSKTSAFYILTLPIVLTFAFSKIYENNKSLLLSIAALMMIGLFLIIARAAMLSIIVSLMAILYQLNKKYFKRVVISLLAVILIFLFIDPLNEIISTLFRLQAGLSRRDYFWQLAYNIIKDNPLWGLGPGSYKYLEFNYSPVLLNTLPGRAIIGLNMVTDGANGSHNIFLNFASDMGIPGILAIFYLLWIVIQISIANYKKTIQGDRQLFLLNLVISAVLGGMFVRGIFDSIGILTYGVIVSDLPFWLMFSILIFFYQKPKEYFTSDEVKGTNVII